MKTMRSLHNPSFDPLLHIAALDENCDVTFLLNVQMSK